MLELSQPKERSARIDRLLQGTIDLHVHSGPSAIKRRLTHIEAMQDAASIGMRAVLFKDHLYSTAPMAQMLNQHFGHLGVQALSSICLNNTYGGFNPYAVEHALMLGASVVWMPTVHAENHIRASYRRDLLPPERPMLAPEALSVLDKTGQITDCVKQVLDLIASYDAVLAAGHLHIGEIFKLFDEAIRRGVNRRVVNHPTYTINATIEDICDLASAGAYIEHEMCMFTKSPTNDRLGYTGEFLRSLISAAGVQRTLFGSDMGIWFNPRPIEGMRSIIELCLELGYDDEEIREMTSSNAAALDGTERLELEGAAEQYAVVRAGRDVASG